MGFGVSIWLECILFSSYRDVSRDDIVAFKANHNTSQCLKLPLAHVVESVLYDMEDGVKCQGLDNVWTLIFI